MVRLYWVKASSCECTSFAFHILKMVPQHTNSAIRREKERHPPFPMTENGNKNPLMQVQSMAMIPSSRPFFALK